MFITVEQLAKKVNNLERFTFDELKQKNNTLKHYKVYFEIEGKKDPFTWFCFATDYKQAKQKASEFLQEELSKGFYHSGMILSIKQM